MGVPLTRQQVLLVLLPAVGCVCLSPCSSQRGLRRQQGTKGEGEKPAFPGLGFCRKQGAGGYCHKLWAESGGMPSGCSSSCRDLYSQLWNLVV